MTAQGFASQLQTRPFFDKGTEVEVSSDEDGFKGSWYEATIVDSSSSKSASKKRKQVLVQYKTLFFDEDAKTPLEEYADLSHVRPVPPSDGDDDSGGSNRAFEEGDVVDAATRDGWWVGVVRNVLGDSRYLVYFDVPPDVMEFSAKDLRPHWDWSNGNWIRSPKEQTNGSIYRSGESVEVNIESKTVSDAWYPAIVIKDCGDYTFFVKYQCPNNGDESGTMKAIVPSTHIRPVPPCFVDRDYDLLETVDIPYESGWRPGSIRKVLAGRRYVVSLNQGNESKELDHSDIRPHVDWVEGKWISQSEKALIVSDNGKQLLDGLNGIANKAGAVKDNSDGKTPSSVKSANGDEKLSSYTFPLSYKKRKLASDHNTQSGTPENLTGGNSVQVLSSAVEPSTDETLRSLGAGSRRSRYSKKIGDVGQNSVITEKRTTIKRVRVKQHKHAEMESEKLEMTAKEGRHTRSPSKCPDALVTDVSVEEKKEGDAAHQDIKKNEDDDVTRERTTEVSEAVRVLKEIDKRIMELKNNLADDDNQPLSMWFGGTQSSKKGSPRDESANGLVHAKERQIDLVANGDVMPHKNQCLPFTKQSSVWETIESMEVFRVVPQNPHFVPLAEQKEEYREGMAIGLMVTFAGLFEKIASLQFDNSRSLFEGIVESLLDLEKHGFDVTLPLSRVNEMLSIKDGQGELLNKSQSAEKELREQSDEKRKLIEKISAIEKKITKLQEELAVSKSKMESKELQISSLQSNFDAMNKTINNAQKDFEKIATAPWNLSR